jgi:hypothetical protein
MSMKALRISLVVFALTLILCNVACSQKNRPIPLDLFDYQWLDSEQVLIAYKFSGEADKDYEALVYLVAKDGKKEIELKAITGDLKGRIAGRTCKIVWNSASDLPSDLVFEGYELSLRVSLVANAGWPWYYYAGAGVVVAGGVAAAVLLTKSDETPPPPTPDIPTPPLRP